MQFGRNVSRMDKRQEIPDNIHISKIDVWHDNDWVTTFEFFDQNGKSLLCTNKKNDSHYTKTIDIDEHTCVIGARAKQGQQFIR